MPFLSINNLSFTYSANTEAQKLALDDISFFVSKGEYLVITGSNGSGKSTLARLISGLLQIQQGTISGDAYRGGVQAQTRRNSRDVINSVPSGIVMQNPKTQLIAETVIKDARFGPENLNQPEDECQKKAETALKLIDLLEASEQCTVTLSGGQQQKLCIAGILALSPELLILDEALSMVDPERRGLILDYIDEYHKNGGTVLSITHNKEEASRAQRLIHLEHGKIAYDGSFQTFYERFAFFKPNYTKSVVLSSQNQTARKVIDIKNLEYAHPKQAKLFENFSLSIQKGTLTAVIGQSGSGKSTLFELLSGLLIPMGGSIYASSRPVLASQDCASTIFEEFAADDVAYGPQQLGISGKELKQRVKRAMDTAGVPFNEYADRHTTFLSGGERRKVSIAGIIALDAEIYLFDEPTAGLDPESAVATIKLMQDLCAQGKTVVFSTHRNEEAEAAERIIALEAGKIISDTADRQADGADAQAGTGAAAKVADAQAAACASAGAGATAENAFAQPANRTTPAEAALSKVEPFANAADIASFSSSALGGYHKGSTIAHRMTPLAKYIVLLAFFVAALSLSNIPLLSAVCAAGIFYALLAHYPVKKLFKNFLIVLPWILLFFVFQLVFFPPKDGETVYFQFYFISLTTRKIKLGFVTLLHYVGVLCPLSVFVYTATESDITDGMEALLKPLALIGIPTKHICLVTSIIFRFIPLLMEEAAVILKAQTVRSSGTLRQLPKKSSLISKFKLLLPLFVPLFIRTLQRAESLAEALDARYYGYY